MKNEAKPDKLKEGSKNAIPVKAEELKTDGPLSEKDEVKKSEEEMRTRAKKSS